MCVGFYLTKEWRKCCILTLLVAPHASFLHPAVPMDATPRESIEVRALVFTYGPVGMQPPHAELAS